LQGQEIPSKGAAGLPSDPSPWTWTRDANVFFGYNYQQRFFLDYSEWESQNWFMASVVRGLGAGRLAFDGMMSLEPFTMQDRGSPQLFQTGESFQRVPLVNYQHPHDFVMRLGATYRVARGAGGFFVGADLVGSPTLGPTAFMHRESARDNPQVPLTHHFLDSTHITPGVVRAGVEFRGFVLESSVFRGEEPDDDRIEIEQPRLDSWAARLRWSRGPWSGQVSGGHMRQPEWYEPYDLTRITASLGFDGYVRARPFKVTLAWGGNRQFNGFNGNADGYLLEWDLRATEKSTIYGRAEVADKELFGLGPHPKSDVHPHFFHKIGALTAGYVRELVEDRWGRFGVGADATVYRIPEALLIYWRSSRSFHLFLRWRPLVGSPHIH
jgi:hypothetical protein